MLFYLESRVLKVISSSHHIFQNAVENKPFMSLTWRVPLATEPGISLIILTPIKILQQNLNRSTLVV